MIRSRLCSKSVLLVLDDVNSIKQLESLAGCSDWFGSGSRIIVTTRDKYLLNNVNELYEIDTLSDIEAHELFCWHAFKGTVPVGNFVQLSNRIVSYARGLPLALEVLGSHLCGHQEDVWKTALDKLKDRPDRNISGALKVSFDSLSDIQQDIFLDIACFFRGHVIEKVNKKLDSFDFHPVCGVTELIDKSLIHISSAGVIQMHDLIQEMGHDIIRRRADKKPERYTRLWDSKDIINVLTEDKGTENVEALVLGFSFDKIKLYEGAFRNMNKLRLLDLSRSNVVRSPNYLPNSLCWLSWFYYPGKSLPGNFRPLNLVSLNLSWSRTLATFPDISCMPNLEFLTLSLCKKLLEVPLSCGVHKKLVHLDLSSCKKLNKFPRIEMESLETLNLRGCLGLRSLPEFHTNMVRLRTLRLDLVNLNEFPWSVGHLICLQEITMKGCPLLPNSLLENSDDEDVHCFGTQPYDSSRMLTLLLSLPSLQKVHMLNCNISEIKLPESIEYFTSLQELDLRDNMFTSLPKSIKSISYLQSLCLRNSKIKKLSKLPSRIMELDLDHCTELITIPNLVDLLDKYENLRILSLADCKTFATDYRLGIWDWVSLTNILCRRQEVLHVLLPRPIETFNSLYERTWSGATVTLSPSWYNDTFRGFVIFATSKQFCLELRDIDGLVTIMPFDYNSWTYNDEHTAFVYIPIHKITSRKNWSEQKDCCLIEVTNSTPVESWGLRLVYDGDDFDKICDRINVNNGMTMSLHCSLKVCVAARNQLR